MPPKKAPAATSTDTNTRPSRKRAAEAVDDAASKRPKRAAAAAPATTPAPKKASTRAAATATKAKPAATTKKEPATKVKKTNGTSSTKKTAVVTKKAPATKTKTSTGMKRGSKKVAEESEDETEEEEVPKKRRAAKPKPPPLNTLPVPTSPTQPLHVFVWGNGDAGQFGLGVDEMNEIGRPKLHTWIEDAITNEKLGKGAGIESIIAGGMHSLAISTSGKVRLTTLHPYYSWNLIRAWIRCGVGV